MKKYLIASVFGLMFGLVGCKLFAATQLNWGTNGGGSWYTPDDGAVMPNQVLQIGSNSSTGYPSVIASTNVTVLGTLTVTGTTTFTGASLFSSSITVRGSITMPPVTGLTIAQLSALTPTTTGQIVFCTNCVNTLLVISTGSTIGGQWAGVFASSLAVPSAVK